MDENHRRPCESHTGHGGWHAAGHGVAESDAAQGPNNSMEGKTCEQSPRKRREKMEQTQ